MQGQHSHAIRTVRFFPTAEAQQTPAPAPCGPAPVGVFASIEVGIPPTIFDASAAQPNLREGRFVVIHSPSADDTAH